jgi:hypothetical protein
VSEDAGPASLQQLRVAAGLLQEQVWTISVSAVS